MKRYYSGGYHKHGELVCLQLGGRADFRSVGLGCELSIDYCQKPVHFYLRLNVLFFTIVFSLELGKDNYDEED